ncbi:hypothetical protein KDA23_04790, partial [Candidatus Saccharibacteria bacterium]|nr:hypothetical protein [Candidatus Saccharibacteria bacterium]
TDLSEKEAGRPVSVRRMTEIVEDPATQVSEVIWTDNGSNPDGIKQLGYYITKVGFGSIHSWSVVNEDIGDEYGISVSPLDSSSEAERSKELSDMVLNQIETTAPLR